jgi:hypothetical protein
MASKRGKAAGRKEFERTHGVVLAQHLTVAEQPDWEWSFKALCGLYDAVGKKPNEPLHPYVTKVDGHQWVVLSRSPIAPQDLQAYLRARTEEELGGFEE